MAALTNACHSPLGGARKLRQISSSLGPAVGQCCVEKRFQKRNFVTDEF